MWKSCATQKILVGVLAMCGAVSGCAWEKIQIEGPPGMMRVDIPAIVKQFDDFGRFLDQEQSISCNTPMEMARTKGFGFLIDLPHVYEKPREAEEEILVHSGKYLEGYEAFREWWRGYNQPEMVSFGKCQITPRDFSRLRYYEVEFRYEEIRGHPLHKEMLTAEEDRVVVLDRLKLVSLDNIILDVRKEQIRERLNEMRRENFGSRIMRFIVSIIQVALGNAPANMAPTPKVQ